MYKKISQLGEIGLIERIGKVLKLDGSVIKGIGDDTAVIKYSKDKYLLFTCDMLIEGLHFLKKHNPKSIGHKALACNISDIASMGGVPRYAVISLGLPRNLPLKYVDAIYRGLSDLARRFGINIVGGDTNRSDKIVIDIALIGFVEKDHLVLRNTAKARDFIFVTGALGGSIRGRHLKFIPRLAEARALVEKFKVSSMIDLSDGLAQDLNRLTKESNIGAVIYEGLIPLHREAKSIDEALYMGEDFELLFTMPPEQARLLLKNPYLGKTKVSWIGEVTDKRFGVRLINNKCRAQVLRQKGFRHF